MGSEMCIRDRPVSVTIYCWTLEEEKGGMVVPIISAFFAGLGLMGSFNGLNTYTAGVYLLDRVAVQRRTNRN